MDNIYQRLVKHFGTQEATAKAVKVDQSTVSGWCRELFKPNPSAAVRAEKATEGEFSRRDLCPDFPWDETAA